ncbi:hypothetical protein GCM10007079_19100 [Nocardiopsis terrae]|nr:hypothetical protein GCM10007079_19100 [Nocardiopsis terrae]
MCVMSLVGMAVSASVLILLVLSLFRPGGQGNVWAVGALACLTVVCAVGVRYWRPWTSISEDS